MTIKLSYRAFAAWVSAIVDTAEHVVSIERLKRERENAERALRAKIATPRNEFERERDHVRKEITFLHATKRTVSKVIGTRPVRNPQ